MNRRGAFILLIALNIAMWFFFAREKTAARIAQNSAAAPPALITQIVQRASPSVVIRTNAFEWTQLEAEDYRTYIARLRSIGCPEETIRDIVIADLEKLMAPRVQEIDGPREAPKYWKVERKDLIKTVDSLEKLGKKQDVDFEKREIIRDLLGVDLAGERLKSKGEVDLYEERLDFLSAEKRSRVRMAIEQANQAEVYLREKSWLENDELSPEEKKQLRELQRKKDEQVKELLTPEELDRYNLWFSPSAYKVRDALSSLDPNEEDFLAVYRIQHGLDEKWALTDPAELSAEQKQSYEQERNDAEAKIREYLGPDRFEQFQQGRDPDFQQLEAAAAQFSLKPQIASEVYGLKRVLEEERATVRNNPQLTLDQKQRIFRALAEEAQASVIEVMGAKPYRYYVRTGGGKWVTGE